jgi:hypothetical protein
MMHFMLHCVERYHGCLMLARQQKKKSQGHLTFINMSVVTPLC